MSRRLRSWPRRLVSALVTSARTLLPIVLTLAGCDQPDYAPPTLIDHLRVIAVRAEPPYLGVAETNFDLLAVGHDPQQPLCYAWSLCLFAWQEGGNYRCIDPELAVDLGNGPTARASVLDLLPLLPKVPEVLQRKGLLPPDELGGAGNGPDGGGGGTDGATDAGDEQQGLEVQLLFQVSERALWGGTCPDTATALSDPCTDRARCVAGFKGVALGVDGEGKADPRYAHANPTLTGLLYGEHGWPEATTLLLAPYRAQPAPAPPALPDTTGLRLEPTFPPSTLEVIQESADPGLPDVQETLVFSFFSTQGTFDYVRTGDNVPSNGFRPGTVADDATAEARAVQLWIVARDNRGGVTWLTRRAQMAAAGEIPDDCIAKLPGASTCVAR